MLNGKWCIYAAPLSEALGRDFREAIKAMAAVAPQFGLGLCHQRNSMFYGFYANPKALMESSQPLPKSLTSSHLAHVTPFLQVFQSDLGRVLCLKSD